MRIDPDIVVQKVDDNHVVIIDESTGQEIVISEEVAARLLPTMQYFFPDLFVDITLLVTGAPPIEDPMTPAKQARRDEWPT